MTQTPDPARIEALQEEIRTLGERIAAAEQELAEERFKGIFRYERGTVVLVPRNLFGQARLWPARIEAVHLKYMAGSFRDGAPYENHHVSYSVFLQQKDGSFGGSSEGFYHHEVMLPPAGAETSS